MKKIISCVLSSIMLMQTLAYSQTVNPTKQQVADIYQKVYNRVNSSKIFKDFSSDNKVTPILAMASLITAVKFDTKEELAALLEQFGIDKKPTAPITELFEEAYAALRVEREADIASLDNTGQQFAKLCKSIINAHDANPKILQSYLEYQKALTTQQELNKAGISGLSADVRVALSNFELECQKAKINPAEFIQNATYARNFLSEGPTKVDLLTQFVKRLAVLDANWLTTLDIAISGHNHLEEILNMPSFSDLPSEEANKKRDSYRRAINKKYFLRPKYEQEYIDAKKESEVAERNFMRLLEEYENKNTFTTNMHRKLQDTKFKWEDSVINYLRKIAKLDTLYNQPDVLYEFTENGGLFVATIALFSLADQLIKVNNIKTNMSNKNQASFALQDALEDNRNNLYALLEQLPDNAQDAAFEYIAEDYFDNFQNQTGDLLFALAVLEKSSLNNVPETKQEIEQKVSDKFDKIYPNAEKSFKQVLTQ